MKILTKEQEQEHYNETLKGGTLGGLAGLAIGTVGVVAATRRYAFFRTLTIPLRAFLITSTATFAGIVSADHYSRAYERASNPKQVEYEERERERAQAEHAGQTFTQRAMEFGRKERYKIVAASWVASMAVAFSLVNRNKYLTGPQKLVQARVYAQFLTVGVLVASAAFEISDKNNETGRYETVKYIDPNDPEHKRMLERRQELPPEDSGDELWKEMVASEEKRMKEKEDEEKKYRKHTEKKSKPKKDQKEEKKGDDKKGDDGKDGKKGDDSKDSKKGDDSKDSKKGEEKKDVKKDADNKGKKKEADQKSK